MVPRDCKIFIICSSAETESSKTYINDPTQNFTIRDGRVTKEITNMKSVLDASALVWEQNTSASFCLLKIVSLTI